MGLVVVQGITNGQNNVDGPDPKFTFGTAPTNGNLMVAAFANYNNASPPAGGGGWTFVSSSDAIVPGATASLYYKYAGASEPTQQQVWGLNSADGMWCAAAWEISGVTGTWTTDFANVNFSPAFNTGTSVSSPSFNTAVNNELVLFACLGNGATGNVISFSIGTEDAHSVSPNADSFSTYDGGAAYHLAEATSGTAVTGTISSTTTTTYYYIAIELAFTTPPPPPSLIHFSTFGA